MEENREISLIANAGNTSQAVSMSTTSAQSAAMPGNSALVSPSVDCFMRQGDDPTALATGVDQFLFGGFAYRVKTNPGQKLAFKLASGTGTVYITPGA